MKKIEKQIAEYFDYCEKIRQMSETTVKFKKYVILKFIDVSKVSELKRINNEVFNKWVAYEIKNGASARSINTYSSIIISMVRYYTESGVLVPLKIKLIKSLDVGLPERKFYRWEDVKKVTKETDFVTGLMIRVMFETGMRIAELTRLRVMDFDGRKVSFIGKGRKMREAYISQETYGLLMKFIAEYKVDDYLWGFAAMNGEPLTSNTIRKRLKEAFLMSGFEGFYPHALRHSFATNLQLKGASVVEIKEMMGHSSVATTERYLHGFEGRLEELFDKYQQNTAF